MTSNLVYENLWHKKVIAFKGGCIVNAPLISLKCNGFFNKNLVTTNLMPRKCNHIIYIIFSVGRESGIIQRYSIPNVILINRYTLNTRPHSMSLNCNTTCLAIIDVTGLLQFLDLDGSRGGNEGDILKFERKVN